MTESPLTMPVMFTLGPVPITTPVVTTWGIMAFLAGGSWLLTRRLVLRPGTAQTVLELVVEAIGTQIRETLRTAPEPFMPLIGTLLLFILTANWSSMIPGVEPPTAHLETDAALALIVFVSMLWFGIRARGLLGYLRGFAEPMLFMAPLNLVETVTRTFSLLVRLFGNVMGGVFVIGNRAVARRPAGAGAADGAGTADRRHPGLHLQRAGNRVHRRRDRRGAGTNRRGPTMNLIEVASIIGAALAVWLGAIGPAWVRAARWPRQWMPSRASRRPRRRCRARCSSAWR